MFPFQAFKTFMIQAFLWVAMFSKMFVCKLRWYFDMCDLKRRETSLRLYLLVFVLFLDLFLTVFFSSQAKTSFDCAL